MATTDTAALVRITGRSPKVHVSGAPGAPFAVDGGSYVVQPDGSIDVTPGTGAVHVTLPGAVFVKGVADPVPVHRLIEPAATPRPGPDEVDR
ncbi:MAG: hypothetical protein ACK5CE_12065 [Actinomycetes bacterium]|jgi:hypothetical protein